MACRHCAEILGGPEPDGADPGDTLALALYSAVVPAGHADTVTSLGRLTATPAR